MRKARTFLILGIWIAILPYLGFPYSWKNILSSITGLVIIFFSYMLYKEYKLGGTTEPTFDNFRENKNFKKELGDMRRSLEPETAEARTEDIAN